MAAALVLLVFGSIYAAVTQAATLAWDENPVYQHVTEYRVWRNRDHVATVTVNTYRLVATSGTPKYRVQACNAIGCSGKSKAVKAYLNQPEKPKKPGVRED